MPNTTAPRTTIPPTTPPAIAPTGVDFFSGEDDCVEVAVADENEAAGVIDEEEEAASETGSSDRRPELDSPIVVRSTVNVAAEEAHPNSVMMVLVPYL